jgi:hypothetical protein
MCFASFQFEFISMFQIASKCFSGTVSFVRAGDASLVSLPSGDYYVAAALYWDEMRLGLYQ